MDLVIEEVDIIEVVCIAWELVIFNADCHGGGGSAAAAAGGGIGRRGYDCGWLTRRL
jgi:hypothetical protein